jgi:predicted transposase/invertase (TIGR01784 family)
MFGCDDYHSSFSIYENDRHELLTDKLSLHFFELNKIPHEIDPDNRKQLWLQFINAATEEEFDMLRNADVPEIKACVDKLFMINGDPEIKEQLRQHEKARLDYNTDIFCARAEGEAIGVAKGRAEIIAKLKRKGFSDAEIQNMISD